MNREQISSVVRHLLSAAGGILVAYGITQNGVVLDVTGTIMSIVAIVWSIQDKTVTIEKVEGTIRQVLTTLGSFFVVFSPTITEQIMSVIVAILPVILGQTDKVDTTATDTAK